MRPVVLIPVKRLELAKSRLDLPSEDRRRVAMMLAEHTLSTAREAVGSGGFAVVTSDDEVQALARHLGGEVIDDPHDALNCALDTALTRLHERHPERPVLVMVADLPWLAPHELDEVLVAVEESLGPRLVRDAGGAGTTCVSVPPGTRSAMRFGPTSAQRFESAGFVPIEDAPRGIRADLDSTEDLLVLHRERRLLLTRP